ncbi:hypothetical protein AB0E69_38685 [Kribbella sp. NPDC026611]|uniref:hypothetical protein n=1 Tax=Kribbella sp. NPDC026611 TaxID=3154911 RepID=UPI0033D26EAD
MSGPARYELVAGPAFNLDYRRLDLAAGWNPGGPEAALRREVLRTLLDLAEGKTNGHHGLTWKPGEGDLRDCVAVYLRSDPAKPADYRLVFREHGPIEAPRRELLAIKPRRGVNNVYVHVLARLRRHRHDEQPGLRRFDAQPSIPRTPSRQADLDAGRAIAQAWAGQQPLRFSRPLRIGSAPAASHKTPASQQRTERPAGARPRPTRLARSRVVGQSLRPRLRSGRGGGGSGVGFLGGR